MAGKQNHLPKRWLHEMLRGFAGTQAKIEALNALRERLPRGEQKTRKKIDDRMYQLRHSASYLEHCRRYYQSHPEKWTFSRLNATPEQKAIRDQYALDWIKKHPERRRATARRYYYRHKELIRKKAWEARDKIAAQLRARRKTDPQFRLRCTLRSRIKSALRSCGIGQRVSIAKLVGCSFDELKTHLEAQFTNGMRWGEPRRTWHVDHIVPLVAFDLSDVEELQTACNWRNLRPMGGLENRCKHRIIPHPLPLWLSPRVAQRIMQRQRFCAESASSSSS